MSFDPSSIPPDVLPLLPLFFDRLESARKEFQDHLKSRQMALLERGTHQYAGSSRGYGCERLGELSLQVEGACQEKKPWPELTTIFEDWDQEAALCLKQFKKYKNSL